MAAPPEKATEMVEKKASATVMLGGPVVEKSEVRLEEQSALLKQLDAMSQRYAEKVVKRPCCMFCTFLWITFLLTAIAVGGGDMVLDTIANADWYISDNPQVEYMDMIDSANGEVELLDPDAVVVPRTVPVFPFQFMYDSQDGETVFTPEKVQAMCRVETVLVEIPEWQDFCMIDTTTSQCTEQHFLSTVNLFYGAGPTIGDACPLLTAESVAATEATMMAGLETEAGTLQYGTFAANYAQKEGYTATTRSIIFMGGPLEGFVTEPLVGDEQSAKYEVFMGVFSDAYFARYGLEEGFLHTAYRNDVSEGGLDIKWFNYSLWNWESNRVFNTDSIMMMFSICFVYFWITVHVGSCFVASIGMLQIFLSIPVSFVFYRYIFQVNYFGTMQMLSVFIILGVGADDVFVYVDAWKQSALDLPEDTTVRPEAFTENEWLMVRRVKYAYLRTLQAVFNTSFTTAMAFVATAVSPIMPISTFGIFSAVAIVVNWLFSITLLPSAVYVSHAIIDPKCCCKKVCGRTDADAGGDAKPKSTVPVYVAYYLRLYSNKKFASVSVVVLGSWALFSIYSAAQLTAPVGVEQWLPPDHMFTMAEEQMREDYSTNEDTAYAQFSAVWGLSSLDREVTGFDRWKPATNRGQVIFDSSFDGALCTAAGLGAIRQACTTLPDLVCDEAGCNMGKFIRADSMVCFLEEFDAHAGRTPAETDALAVADCDAFETELKAFRVETQPGGDPMKSWETIIGVVDGAIKFVTVDAVLSMKLLEPEPIKEPVYEIAEAWVASIPTPKGMTSVFQFSWDWTWSASQRGMISGMSTGMAIAFPVAFLTLCVATANIVLAFAAIITVGFITAGVLGYCSLVGWDLGTGEAIAGVMVIGLAVDYTIHLAHMYEDAKLVGGIHDRVGRYRYAIEKMGGTVIAGAVTTAGSGLFMLACQSTFFPKMATLISGTILYSLVYALGFFMPMMSLVGPEGEFGSIPVMLKKLTGKQ